MVFNNGISIQPKNQCQIPATLRHVAQMHCVEMVPARVLPNSKAIRTVVVVQSVS